MIKRNINGVNVEVHGSDDVRIVSVDKPKRFVDLLAEGEEFIECAKSIFRIHGGLQIFQNNKWSYDLSVEGLLFRPATSAKNPEKKKKVVYQFVMQNYGEKYAYTTPCMYENVAECKKDYPQATVLQLIEESGKEIEE